MRLKRLAGQDGRNNLSVEAKVRAVKLWKIDGVDPGDVLNDIENTFGVTLTEGNHKQPTRFLKQIEGNIIRMLSKEENVHKSRLIKLLQQAGLIGTVKTDDDE
jgi:hypothetical protein